MSNATLPSLNQISSVEENLEAAMFAAHYQSRKIKRSLALMLGFVICHILAVAQSGQQSADP